MKKRFPLIIVLIVLVLSLTAQSTLPSTIDDSGWTTTNSPDWIGTGEDWALWSDEPLDAWTEYLADIQKWHFNTLRLSFRFPDAPAITHTPLNHEQLDAILNILSADPEKISRRQVDADLEAQNAKVEALSHELARMRRVLDNPLMVRFLEEKLAELQSEQE